MNRACIVRVVAASVLASGLTYGGVTLATPAPTLVSDTSPCPNFPANQLQPSTQAQCDYYNDLFSKHVPIVSNAIPNMRHLCQVIKSNGGQFAAEQLVTSFQYTATPLSIGQALTYVSVNQQDVTC